MPYAVIHSRIKNGATEDTHKRAVKIVPHYFSCLLKKIVDLIILKVSILHCVLILVLQKGAQCSEATSTSGISTLGTRG